MIIGTGIDIVSVKRIKEAETRWGERFLNRIFTSNELKYSLGRKFPHVHLAARFASKEAMVKALGTGFSQGISWKNIEVVNRNTGKPEIILRGKAQDLAGSMGVINIHVSIAHDDGYAISQVLIEGSEGK